MKAPRPETTYELCPAGTHIARLYKIIFLGTHEGEYMGAPKVSSLVRIYWELPNEVKEYEKEVDGVKTKVSGPFAISREFTFSMGEKSNLRKIVQGMLGVSMSDEEAYDFDIEKLLGTPCLLTVVHETAKTTGNKFALVSNTAPLMKGMEAPDQVNKSEMIDTTLLSEEEIGKLPQWLMDKVRESREYKARAEGNTEKITKEYPTEDINPQDIPF